MSTTLLATAALMGLAGGPHCAAMCGAACAAITGAAGRPSPAGAAAADAPAATVAQPLAFHPGAAHRQRGTLAVGWLAHPVWSFQLGRLAGYALAGAAAAALVQSLAWLTTGTAPLRPLWTLLHLLVLAWGLTLAVLARPPGWAQRAGLALWARVGPLVRRPGGSAAAGLLWTFMPCGLLYSALLVASLSGGPVQGAAAMALFAATSSLGLLLGPQLLARVRGLGNRFGPDWGTRLAGALLAGTAAWALSMDLAARVAAWCL